MAEEESDEDAGPSDVGNYDYLLSMPIYSLTMEKVRGNLSHPSSSNHLPRPHKALQVLGTLVCQTTKLQRVSWIWDAARSVL